MKEYVRSPGNWPDLDEVNYFKDVEIYSNKYKNRLSVGRVLDEKFPYSMKHVTFLVPAYNEEKSIGRLLDQINKYRKSKVVVVDNNSQDRTAEIAEESGAQVLEEKKQGKGNAIKTGFQNIKSLFVIMLDADNTYDPEEAKILLEPLIKNEADVVMGCRLNKKMEDGAISDFNMVGNRILSYFASLFFSDVNDVCTGYWAFRSKVIKHLLTEGIESDGFDLEVEMFSKISRAGFRVQEVPIRYKNRSDDPKLNSVTDGAKIFKRMLLYWLRKAKKDPRGI